MMEPTFISPILPPYPEPRAHPSQSQLPLGRGPGPHGPPGQPLEHHLPQRPETSCSARDLCKRAGAVMSPQGDYLPEAGPSIKSGTCLRWPCNVEGGGSPRAPVAQGAGLSPAPALVHPAPDGAPPLKGLRTGPHRGRGPDRLGARLDVTGVQNGRVSPRPPCKYWGSSISPARGPRPPARRPTSPPAHWLPGRLAISGKLVFPPWSSWPGTQQEGHWVLRACLVGQRWALGGAVVGGA